MDGFWSSRFNNHIDLPDKIGSFSCGATTSMVVKNGTKKTIEGFLNVLNVINMSHRNGSSTFVFSSYRVFKTSYGFCRPVATTFTFEDGRVSLTLWVKFLF